MSEYSAEDFAQANRATRGELDAASRVDPGGGAPWRFFASSGVAGWLSDEDMARGGWVPVVESRITEHTLRDSQEKAVRKRERLVDHIADQDRVIRRRNDEIKALRLELADAQAPLSLGSLAAAYEAAEQADECRKDDVLIRYETYGDYAGYVIYRAVVDGSLTRSRILSRAPRREPWSDLADALRGTVWERLSGDVDGLAAAVHAAGWRKGGDDGE